MRAWRWMNLADAARVPFSVSRNHRALSIYRKKLRTIAASLPSNAVAGSESKIRAIHFVYGLKQVEEFPFYAFVSVLSAQRLHPTARTFFHYHHEPTGRFWDLLKNRVEHIKVPAFGRFGCARVTHYAHKADIVRLLALHEVGGLYLDCDTITLKNMDHLAQHEFVMGSQATIPGAMGGLCNAIMVANRGSDFGRRWLKTYSSFRSSGRDSLWDFHSVKLPLYLYSQQPDKLLVLPHDAWFFPLWTVIDSVLFSETHAEANFVLLDGLAIHLWHNVISDKLDKWSPADVAKGKTNYARLCAQALTLLPPGALPGLDNADELKNEEDVTELTT